jgi:hypothetical protein
MGHDAGATEYADLWMTRLGGTTSTPPPGDDTTAPSVYLTSPRANTLIRGAVTISAEASDDVGVVGVSFRLDGLNLGPEDATSPYQLEWMTSVTSDDGPHTLTAVARDAAGNTSRSPPVTVTVLNARPTPVPFTPGTSAVGCESVSFSASGRTSRLLAGRRGAQLKLCGVALEGWDVAVQIVAGRGDNCTSGRVALTPVLRVAEPTAGLPLPLVTLPEGVSLCMLTTGTGVSVQGAVTYRLVHGKLDS